MDWKQVQTEGLMAVEDVGSVCELQHTGCCRQCVQYLHAEVLKGLQPDSMIISFTLSGAQNVTFNCQSLDSPDKLKICLIFLFHAGEMYWDISQLCTCRLLISRTCHHNVSNSGSLDLIWDNILDYFQEKWKKTIVQSTNTAELRLQFLQC